MTDTTDPNLATCMVSTIAETGASGDWKAAREAVIDKDGIIVSIRESRLLAGAQRDVEARRRISAQVVSRIGGDADDPRLAQFANGKDELFNMPMVAFNVSADDLNKMCDGNVDDSKVEEKVLKICPRDGTVTLKLTLGYTFGKLIFDLSTEANDPVVAALEGATYTPALKDVPFAPEDASPGKRSASTHCERTYPGVEQPFRQGLESALRQGHARTLNVLRRHPTINLDQSPLWRLFPVKMDGTPSRRAIRTKMTDDRHRGAGERGDHREIAGEADGGRNHHQLPRRLPHQLESWLNEAWSERPGVAPFTWGQIDMHHVSRSRLRVS